MRTLSVDPKRHVIIPGDYQESLNYAIEDWLETARRAISEHGYFAVALSGGSTPKAIFEGLAKQPNAVDWSKVLLFWSDERAVAKTDPDSNYKMAMDALGSLPIDPAHIFPMEGLGDLEENAKAYETLIEKNIPSKKFDLMMLGMGDDGHTASLFPKTHGLHAPGRTVIANFIPEKSVWRLSVTFDCINASHKSVVYVLGAGKAEMIQRVFSKPIQGDFLPVQNIGKDTNPALYILDKAAARLAFNGTD
jgi:6-phosphogluconolactonase